MNNNLTEIVFILDRSGSMAGLEDDNIGGAVRYSVCGEGTELNYRVVSETVSRVRQRKEITADWSALIAENYRKQGK